MTEFDENIYALADENTTRFEADEMSGMFEQESRRYCRRLSEEEEARLR